MITIVGYPDENGDSYVDLRGMSTDTKPTDEVGNGSTFYEIDTGAYFVFDADGKEWYEKT